MDPFKNRKNPLAPQHLIIAVSISPQRRWCCHPWIRHQRCPAQRFWTRPKRLARLRWPPVVSWVTKLSLVEDAWVKRSQIYKVQLYTYTLLKILVWVPLSSYTYGEYIKTGGFLTESGNGKSHHQFCCIAFFFFNWVDGEKTWNLKAKFTWISDVSMVLGYLGLWKKTHFRRNKATKPRSEKSKTPHSSSCFVQVFFFKTRRIL